MMPEIFETPLKDVLLLKPRVFKDPRGYFVESYRLSDWAAAGIPVNFIQDNQSFSAKNTLRGLHFQLPPAPQAKLVRAIRGSILDVVVDLRKSSPTYGRHFKEVLSGDNFLQLYVPEGFAHGFLTLEEDTMVAYKCSEYYRPELESGLAWNDPSFDIDWNITEPLMSDKDRKYKPFTEFNSPF